MLSIGKLAAGQAKYYLDQAEARVDVVAERGRGDRGLLPRADRGRGEWIGAAARELGPRRRRSTPEALRRVLAGLDPRDGAPLRASASPARVAGFDLTFSAPKSVSVLFGLGDPQLRGLVRKAHDVAALRGGSATWSGRPLRCGAATAARSSRRRRASWPRRSGTGRRGRAIRSCTRTSWSRTSGAGSTGGGRRSTGGGCTRTRARRASSTRRCCGASSRATVGVRVDARAARDRRGRGCAAAGDAGVQPAAGRDRRGAGRAWDVGRSGGGGGRARDAPGEGSAGHRGGARGGVARHGRRRWASAGAELELVARATAGCRSVAGRARVGCGGGPARRSARADAAGGDVHARARCCRRCAKRSRAARR